MLHTDEEVRVFTNANGKEYVVLDMIIMEFDFSKAKEVGSWYFNIEPELIQIDEAWVTEDDELYLIKPDKPAMLIWIAYVKEIKEEKEDNQ